jgi:uncharacterized membrane protein YidH (DUF202 family)
MIEPKPVSTAAPSASAESAPNGHGASMADAPTGVIAVPEWASDQDSERDAWHAAREAEREAEAVAKERERDARHAAKEAEREAKSAAKEAEREAKHAAKEAEREARHAAKEAEHQAKIQEREAEHQAKLAKIELAYGDRIAKLRLDGDKLLLRWLRTSLVLVSCGIFIERGLAFLDANATGPRLDPFFALRLVALGLVLVGLASLWFASHGNWRRILALDHGEAPPVGKYPLALIVSLAVAALCLVAFFSVLATYANGMSIIEATTINIR